MNENDDLTAMENPFCTRRVRPGAIPYQFPAGQTAESLVGQLRDAGWRGQIVGAHGSGKSALLAALIPAIEQAGRSTLLIELHDGQRRLPIDLGRDPRLAPPLVVIVDGYEQLSRWSRFQLNRCCRRRGLGLLATSHGPVGLPDLARTLASPGLAEQIVGELLRGRQWPLTATELRNCYRRHGGDLRELLFELYDLYEKRRP